jgi:hypothetical protein
MIQAASRVVVELLLFAGTAGATHYFLSFTQTDLPRRPRKQYTILLLSVRLLESLHFHIATISFYRARMRDVFLHACLS